uniref:RAB6-interacting golgin n=2 Tax=Cuerna arida TaxID=1464854 RepID=A0A1B6FQ09_9HEMI
MTDKWEGFSPEEILKIANQKHPITKKLSQSNSTVKKSTFGQSKFSKKNMTRERMLKTHQVVNREHQGNLPQQARLYIPQIPEEEEFEDSTVEKSLNSVASGSVPLELSNVYNTTGNCEQIEANNTATIKTFTAVNEVLLEDFEKRQKMIKEQNRQRKELLKKALEDRTKKTHEEARRLSQIEDELKKLDLQLSNDVSVLRNQIEVASLEFMEAQKRFDRAEKEYLDAKLALFTKKERKELLTGHLCTIIEQNELRKAKKLSDLMDKLQLGSVVIEKSMEKPGIKTDGGSTENNISFTVPSESQVS